MQYSSWNPWKGYNYKPSKRLHYRLLEMLTMCYTVGSFVGLFKKLIACKNVSVRHVSRALPRLLHLPPHPPRLGTDSGGATNTPLDAPDVSAPRQPRHQEGCPSEQISLLIRCGGMWGRKGGTLSLWEGGTWHRGPALCWVWMWQRGHQCWYLYRSFPSTDWLAWQQLPQPTSLLGPAPFMESPLIVQGYICCFWSKKLKPWNNFISIHIKRG